MLETPGLAGDVDGMELDDEVRVGVVDGKLDLTHSFDGDAQLLTEFTARRVENGLANLEFSSGKFPESAVSFVGGALADEVVRTSADYSSDHSDTIRGSHRGGKDLEGRYIGSLARGVRGENPHVPRVNEL